jgi:hypothetical protein
LTDSFCKLPTSNYNDTGEACITGISDIGKVGDDINGVNSTGKEYISIVAELILYRTH